ncbi:AAA family ATPase [Mycobacteroides abscessus]|uniref:AAA family ATPase n=1 Tax=Mycobacteroides abscessus TaxID=36809 RepID=UPI000927AFAF|nr:AAA family ATPase [Mycobacteroides abscessus]SHY42120.1 Bifunctional DNA primase/polymerase, N-terminal [Mycobacteroides abscessus subsp. abscessus]
MTTSSREALITDYVSRGWVPFAYLDDWTLPMEWQRTEITESTVRDCAAVDYPVGVVLGKPSNLVVVDVDVQHGGDIQSFMDRYGRDETRTRAVATPSGGYHLYYGYPKDIDFLPKRINAGRWIDGLQGIDLFADGQHVQVPPSLRVNHPTKPDGQYRLLGDNDVAPLPAGLLTDWLESLATRKSIEGNAVDVAPAQDRSWMVELHHAKVREAASAPVGSRDDTVFKCLCVSVRMALYLPDDVLTVEQVQADYEDAYEQAQGDAISGMAGKMQRAIELAKARPWVVESDHSVTQLPEDVPEHRRSEFDNAVANRIYQQRVKEEADRRLVDARIEAVDLPPVLTGEALTPPSKTKVWAVNNLLAPKQSVLVTAQKKAGKSTLVLNLILSLTTGEPFLGEYTPARPMRVAYFDMELGRAMASSYIEQLGIPRDNLFYVDLLGSARFLDTRNDALRARWVRKLIDLDIDIVIVDPVSPILSAANLDENSTTGVRQLLDSFNTMSESVGCYCGPVVVHHAGWEASGRARGSSAFGDWPGAEWNLRKADPEDPYSRRSFAIQSNRATGGVVHTPRPTEYDHATRRVSYGRSEQPPLDPKRAQYEEYVGATNGPISVRDIENAAGVSEHTARKWLDGDARLRVISEGGKGGAGPRMWSRYDGEDPFAT